MTKAPDNYKRTRELIARHVKKNLSKRAIKEARWAQIVERAVDKFLEKKHANRTLH